MPGTTVVGSLGVIFSFLAPTSKPSTSLVWSQPSSVVPAALLAAIPTLLCHFTSSHKLTVFPNSETSLLSRVDNSQGKPEGYFLKFLIPILLKGFPLRRVTHLGLHPIVLPLRLTQGVQSLLEEAEQQQVEPQPGGSRKVRCGDQEAHGPAQGGREWGKGSRWEEERHPQPGPTVVQSWRELGLALQSQPEPAGKMAHQVEEGL